MPPIYVRQIDRDRPPKVAGRPSAPPYNFGVLHDEED